MAFDGLFLHMMMQELADFAVGSKIDKIYLPTKYEMVIGLRSRVGNRKLFISVGGNAPRIGFTENVPENPTKPPMLCMLFRKLLTGAVITGFRQQGLDRILFIDMDAANEIGDRVKRTLVVEIMAQYSNCILLDDNGRIIDSLKRVDGTKSSFREVLPGLQYVLPPAQDKLDIMSSDPDIIKNRLIVTNKTLSSALLSTLSGFSPLLSKEIAYRVCLGDKTVETLTEGNWTRLFYELESVRDMLISGEKKPCFLISADGELIAFSFLPLTYMANDAKMQECASLSALLDAFYTEKEKKLRARVQADDLFKTVNALLERTVKKINVRRAELPGDEEIEEKRICAELINVNISFLPKGASEYELQNYYENNALKKIKAYPELSPQKNAQKYYKEYKKAQTAKKVLAEQIENGLNELEYLQTVQDELSRAESYSELAEIRRELQETGFIKSASAQSRQKKPTALSPLEFKSPDGFSILVGRNNLQNDRLSFKLAQKTDIWFHVQKAPGSHVVLCLEGTEPTKTACEFAAGLAVWFSSVRDRGKAEVDYTQVKNLKKPPSSNPGFVIYHVYKTIYAQAVNPNMNGGKRL